MPLRALILTAGLGTRLRPLTYVRAKAAVPVNGEPIVRRVIAWMAAQGLDDLVLNLHHRPASIGAAVGDGRDLGARVRYSWESRVLGSAGGPRHALPLLVDGMPAHDRRFVMVNGDTLTDLELADMIAAHRASGALVTMALIPNPHPDLYGGVLVEHGRVAAFTRRTEARTDSFHFIGVQIAEARVFAQLPAGVPAESVMGVYPDLIRNDPASIRGYVVNAGFRDIGTPAEYLRTSLELAAIEGDRLASGARSMIAPSAEVRRTAVWDDVRIGAHARLHECIVCDGVTIPDGSRYERCAIAPYEEGHVLRDGERLESALVIRNI